MAPWENANRCLQSKMQVLYKIAANTETQCRFIHKRKMKGLRRALHERDALLEELRAINSEWASNHVSWSDIPGLKPAIQDAANLERSVIERSRQVLQQAIAEKARIASEIRNLRIQGQVKTNYVTPWTIVTRGLRINEKC